MRTLSIDIETYSSVSLQESGVYAYSEAPDFSILLFAYAFDQEEVQIIDLAQGDMLSTIVLGALTSDKVIKTAYNANFERTCLSRYLDIPMPPHQWRCTAVHASVLGLPGNLAGVCSALGFNEDLAKSKTGKALIQYFCVPCKPTTKNGNRTRNLPEHDLEKWQLFKEYCKQDVVAERTIKDRLSMFPVTQSEQELWELDQKINDQGILIDLPMVENIIAYDEQYQQQLLEEAQRLTGLSNPNSVAQVKNWLREQGINPTGLDKEKVAELIQTTEGTVKRVLELRQAMSKTSIKKYEAMKRAACKDQRVRGCFQFYGANRSGRWSGRLVQLQNLPQNKIPDIDLARQLVIKNNFDKLELLFGETPFVLSQLVRTAFIPSKGNRFIISDFSAIEARVIAWLAGEQWRLDVFNSHGKIYEASASKMFKVPIESIGKGSPLRQKGKVAELACIAEDELVLTNQGLIPIQYVQLHHKLWDGTEWVRHEGVIDRGIKEVIEYEGLKATKDHLVWVTGKQESVQFGAATASGAHLLQTGNGRRAIRLGKDHQSRKKMVKDMESLSCFNTVYKLWKCTMDNIKQFDKRKIKRVPTMFKTKKNSCVVGQETNRCQATLRKSKGCSIPFVWSKRDTIQIQVGNRSRIMDIKEYRQRINRFRTRSNRLQWPLRTRKSKICITKSKSREQKTNCIIRVGSEILAVCKNCCNKNAFIWDDKGRNNCFSRIGSKGEKEKLGTNSSKARVYDIRNAGPRHRFTVSGKLVHNCGYQGGVGALKAMGSDDMGLNDTELQILINDWREANPYIVKLWGTCEEAAKKAIESGWSQDIGKGVLFSYEKGYLFIQLPSGRKLAYYDVAIQGRQITYMGLEQQSKRWSRLNTYGGKLVENIVQAIARDCLAEAMKRLDRAGYTIVMHCHDEVVIDTDKGTIDEVTHIMSQDIDWAPGLPLRGDTYEAVFYRKD